MGEGPPRQVLRLYALPGSTTEDVARIEEMGWPMHRMVPFRREFLAGVLTRAHDRDPVTAWETEPSLADRVIGGMSVDISTEKRQLREQQEKEHERVIEAYRRVLVPVYIVSVEDRGSWYHILINGSGGKVLGQVPTRPLAGVKWRQIPVGSWIALLVIIFIVVAGIASGLGLESDRPGMGSRG